MSESHSAQFGLDPSKNNSSREAGAPIRGTEGAGTGTGSAKSATTSSTQDSESSVGPASQPPGTGNERPGAGGSQLAPSQGNKKAGDKEEGMLEKLNPLK